MHRASTTTQIALSEYNTRVPGYDPRSLPCTLSTLLRTIELLILLIVSVKATILSHEAVKPEFAEEIHRFRYQLNNGISGHDDYVTLRTARVIAASLDGGNAFVRMLREIVSTDAVNYDRLVGMTFDDRCSDEAANKVFAPNR